MGNAWKYVAAVFIILGCVGVGAFGGCFVGLFAPSHGEFGSGAGVGLVLGGLLGVFVGGLVAMNLLRR